MTLDMLGFIVGIIGAMWMKSAMALLDREREQNQQSMPRGNQESPAVQAFVRGLSLVLVGLGLETFARLFIN
jgi:hypothetical protein